MQSAKRVVIRLRWKGAGGQWQAPVRLTAWIEPGRSAADDSKHEKFAARLRRGVESHCSRPWC